MNHREQPEKLLTEKQAARYLQLSPRSLAGWRFRSSDGLPFVKISATCVRYRQSDLDAFIEARVRTSTSDPGPSEA